MGLSSASSLDHSGEEEPEHSDEVPAAGSVDVPGTRAFERLTRLARRLLDAPVAFVSLLDEDQQLSTCAGGLPEPWAGHPEMPLVLSLCQQVAASGEPLIVADVSSNPSLRDD